MLEIKALAERRSSENSSGTVVRSIGTLSPGSMGSVVAGSNDSGGTKST